MPKKITPLSDAKVKAAKAEIKERSLFDGGGLFLLIPAIKYGLDGKPLPASEL